MHVTDSIDVRTRKLSLVLKFFERRPDYEVYNDGVSVVQYRNEADGLGAMITREEHNLYCVNIMVKMGVHEDLDLVNRFRDHFINYCNRTKGIKQV